MSKATKDALGHPDTFVVKRGTVREGNCYLGVAAVGRTVSVEFAIVTPHPEDLPDLWAKIIDAPLNQTKLHQVAIVDALRIEKVGDLELGGELRGMEKAAKLMCAFCADPDPSSARVTHEYADWWHLDSSGMTACDASPIYDAIAAGKAEGEI